MAKRYLMWVSIAFVCALFLCAFFPLKPLLIIAGAALFLGIICLFLPFSLKQTVFSCTLSAMLAISLFGGMQSWISDYEEKLINEERLISGQITEIGQNSAKTLACYQIKLDAIEGKPLRFYQSFSINLYTDASLAKVGDHISGVVQFFDSPIDFGYGREEGIYLSGYQIGEQLKIEEPKGFSWVVLLHEFQTNIQGRLSYGNSETEGLLQSLCFGNKESLDSELGVSLRRNGLSHVTAVSGLHLSFAVMLVNYFLMLLGIHYRVRYTINIFVSIFFTVVVGFPASCVRSCIMMVLFCLAMALRLFPDGLTSLSAAAVLLCLYNPFIVRDVGFLLSVLATAGIILLKLPIEHFLFPKRLRIRPFFNRIYRYFTGIFACSLAASIFTLPVTVWFFGSFSLIGPLANVLLILPLQICFILGIFMILLGWIPGVGALIGWLCDLIYYPFSALSKWIGHFRYANVSSVDEFGILFIILFAALLMISVYHYRCYQRRSFFALTSMLIFFFTGMLSLYSFHSEEKVKIAFIDVGQGDCTVISKGGAALVFDYGGSSDKRYNLMDYFDDQQIHIVDLMAFTHLHADHTNGLPSLLKNAYVDRLLFPYGEDENMQLISMLQSEDGELLKKDSAIYFWDEIKVEPYLDPSFSGEMTNDNERCICYRVSFGSVSVLITGDLQGKAETKLLDRDLDCTFLKVAHHGSATSSLYPFLKAASPEVAILSVGENSFGLPHGDVVSRLKTICPSVYSTREDGTIIFETDGKSFERIF